MMATTLRATKLTMMATTMNMATGDDDNGGEGTMGNSAMGYDDDNDGDGDGRR